MSLSLQQKINVRKNVGLAESVSLIEKVVEAIQKVAQDVCNGQITNADTVFTGHPVTADQLTGWALKALRNTMNHYMVPMILDNSRLPADPLTATDRQLTDAVKESIWPFAKLITTDAVQL